MKLRRSGKTSQYNPFFSGQEGQQTVSETSKRARAGTKEHDNEDNFLAEDDRSSKPVFLSYLTKPGSSVQYIPCTSYGKYCKLLYPGYKFCAHCVG